MSLRLTGLLTGSLLAALAHVLTAGPPSGPAVGDVVYGFPVYMVTGKDAGKPADPMSRNGESAAVIVFAKELRDDVVELVKKVDGANEINFLNLLVMLDGDKAIAGKLKDLEDKGLKNATLTHVIDRTGAGPRQYKIAKDADVTVVLVYRRHAKAAFSFAKGELDAGGMDKIVAEMKKIAASAPNPQVGDRLAKYKPTTPIGFRGVQECETC